LGWGPQKGQRMGPIPCPTKKREGRGIRRRRKRHWHRQVVRVVGEAKKKSTSTHMSERQGTKCQGDLKRDEWGGLSASLARKEEGTEWGVVQGGGEKVS